MTAPEPATTVTTPTGTTGTGTTGTGTTGTGTTGTGTTPTGTTGTGTTPQVTGVSAGFDTCRARYGTFPECPLCHGALTPEHAHFKCRSCGWRDSCCD